MSGGTTVADNRGRGHRISGQSLVARFTGTPALVVEVLSGNRGDDLLVKMNKYPATGLPYYWIVDPRERTLATFVRDDSGAFRASRVVYEADGTVELELGVARVSLALTDVLPQD